VSATVPPPTGASEAPARLRGWRGAAALAGVTIVLLALILGAMELVAAAILARRAEPTSADVPTDFVARTLAGIDLAPEINPTPLRACPVLLWRNTPNATKTQPVNPTPAGTAATWTIVTDAAGRRGPPVGPRDPHRYRVLCIGDSITFGFNVDQDDPFPRQLETLLAARWPGHEFEVINAGVPGWSWAQGVRYLVTEGLALEPDVVVMAHGTNDQFYPVTTTDLEHLGPPPGSFGQLIAPLVGFVQRTSTARLFANHAPAGTSEPSPGCRQQSAAPGGCRRVSLPQIEALVREARAATQAAGADLVVLNVDFMATRAVQGVRPAVEAEGIPFLDMVARVDALRAQDERARTERLGLAPAGPLDDEPREDGSRRLVLRVTGVPPGGAVGVAGEAEFFGSFRFDVPMHDDGADGDEVAGDGVYSATVLVPAKVASVGYRFHRDGEPEFKPLPPLPSTQGVRSERMTGPRLAPVAEYGQLFLMAERTHPNRAGHRLIADALVDVIAGLPSLRAFLARSGT
jgi:lysophospholipase L1-like esterase